MKQVLSGEVQFCDKTKNHRRLRPREQARMKGATRAPELFLLPSLPFVEGEARRALPAEGATRAPIIDTHCHLNDPSFASSLPEVIERARVAGVSRIIVPAYDSPSLTRTAEIVAAFPATAFPAFGIHPWHASDNNSCIEDIRCFLVQGHAVAIGEIGLDLAPETPPVDLQRKLLVLQLDLAVDLDLPVMLHCRRAQDQLFQMLRPYAGRIRGVMHSFSGSTEQMMRFLQLGFYIGFSGSVTRETAHRYHKNALLVPLDRLLLETDAPSIATATTVASEVEPRHTFEVAEKVASLRDMPVDEVCRRSTENAIRLFWPSEVSP